MDRTEIAGKAGILGQYDFFRTASPQLQDEMVKAASIARIPEGTVVFDRGGLCNFVALVGAGSLRVYIANENTGREISLYRVGPGETCPVNLLSSLLDKPAPANAVVESDVEAVTLPPADFKQWMKLDDRIRDFMIEGLAARYIEVFEQIHEITFGKLDQRLADLLLKKFSVSTVPVPAVVATHEQIALDLSTAREVVSRLLREFERMGAVDLGRGRVTLRDEKCLKLIRG